MALAFSSRPKVAGRNYVPGAGPQPCAYMWLGEGPGKAEDAFKQPFVGPTGQFLDDVAHALNRTLNMRHGTHRPSVRVENVTRYLPLGKELTAAEVERDRPALLEAFAKTKPRYVFAMGRWAAEATVGHYLRERGLQIGSGQVMDWLNGLTFEVPAIDDPKRKVIVTCGYHPAAALRSGGAAAKFFAAFRAYAQAVHDQGRNVWPEFRGDAFTDSLVGVDTESLANGDLWCVTTSHTHEGDKFWPEGTTPESYLLGLRTLVVHNLTYDWNELLKVNVDMDEYPWHDTLPYARSLQVEPGKLKLLTQRYLGEPRQEYEAVLAPYAREAWAGYIARVVSACEKRKWWALRDGSELSLATRVKSLSKSPTPATVFSDLPARYQSRIRQACGAEPKLDLSQIPFEVAEKYAIQDARDARRLYPILRAKCEAAGTVAVAEQDEAMIPMLALMERTGMPIDRDRLLALQQEMEREEGSMLARLRELAASEKFNPNSPDDVAGLLFNEIGARAAGRQKKTATGKDSTSSQVLDTIRAGLLSKKANEGGLPADDERALDFLSLLGDYRHVRKLLGTNIRPMWEYIDATGRVHPRFKQGGADDETGEPVVSGRYAMDRPNWLAFPAHSQWAKKARAVVRPPEGRVILVVDLDQIEMREMAHQSGDEVMREVFETGEDIHARTARYVFKVEKGSERAQIPGIVGNEITYRQAAKTLGFLLLFGGQAYGYARKMAESGLLLTEEEAEESRNGWLSLYSGVPRFWKRMEQEALKHGHVRTPLGRPRYLPGIWSSDPRMAAEAARQAGNHPIQGGAQERLKKGAIRVYNGLGEWRKKGYVAPLLTIHDELDFEVDEGMAEEFGKWVVQEMTRGHEMKVPIRANASFGKDWGAAK